MINITDKAIAKLKELREVEASKGKANQLIRIAVTGGGCSGLRYGLNWVDAPTVKDLTFQFGDLTAVVDDRSIVFLKGLNLDYEDDLNNQGFVYQNPNSQRSCGCGTSFNL